jgi:phosphoglycolate phosphatase-like HAD superfamily hydrolase
MLILFDIDGTLLLTQKAGMQAMLDGGRELFGERFTIDGVEFSGRLDPLIWNDLAQRNGVPNHDGEHDRFRAAYGRHLRRRLNANPTATLLPGVKALVEALPRHEGVTIGVLTGNYPETGQLKIERAGLQPSVFPVAAWGIDGTTRRDLPPVAIRRHFELTRRTLDATDVVIIGDTPHDIDCASCHGCRSIGVATGTFDTATLREAGADLAVDTLAEVEELLAWMLRREALKTE